MSIVFYNKSFINEDLNIKILPYNISFKDLNIIREYMDGFNNLLLD